MPANRPTNADSYALEFELGAYHALDNYALLACQAYNLTNDTDWFGNFRGGLYGFYSRLYGVESHFRAVHEWLPRPRLPSETEHHIASVFFCMDSALECLTFALNAFGFAAFADGFRDVTSSQGLRLISPHDILGRQHGSPPTEPLAGYSRIFPSLLELWKSNEGLISSIRDQHDVSKHRKTIFSGGMARQDPPEGFYESLGVRDDAAERALFWPMAEVILLSDPKRPRVERSSERAEQRVLLEGVADGFRRLVNASGEMALADATSAIELKHY